MAKPSAIPSLTILFAFFCACSFAAAASSKVATAWFAGFHADLGFAVSNISWSKYTELTYAFAETTSDVHTLSLSEPDVLPQFVAAAHKNGVKAKVSIGGWTGSRFFSTAVGSAQNRTAFVNTVVNLAKNYSLDGIDFDWEYPGLQGIGCNTISSKDTANFLTFLKQLRQNSVGASLILSAATAIFPFTNANGDPSTDISGFVDVLDYIEVMNYDIWGPWSATVGPNAPLNDTCASPDNQQGSAVSAIQKWNAAGMPLDQIVLGIPAYGHSFRVNKTSALKPNSATQLNLYPPFDPNDTPAGDAWDDAPGVDECGNEQAQGGDITFWGLIQKGLLTPTGDIASGVPNVFDNCSQTPFVYDVNNEDMISYDNAKSMAAKGAFIKKMGLKGFAMWEAGGDSNNILIDAIRSSAGF